MEKVKKCGIKKESGYLYFVDGNGDAARIKPRQTTKEIICKNDNEFKKEVGWMYFIDKSGDISRAKIKSFKGWAEVKDQAPGQLLVEKKKMPDEKKDWSIF